MGLAALCAAACLTVFVVRRHRKAQPRRRHVPPAVQVAVLLDRAGLSDVVPMLGINTDFGFLQHRVLAAATVLRMVSVSGTIRLPGALDVDIADGDWPVVAAGPEAFLHDVAFVLRDEAAKRGWEIAGELDLRFATLGIARPGQPHVAMALHRGTPGSLVKARSRSPKVQRDVLPPTSDLTVRELRHDDLPPTSDLTVRELRHDYLPPTSDLTNLPSTAHAPGLSMVSHGDSVPAIRLGSADDHLVVGRDTDVGLVLAHKTVSARHCRLQRGAGGAWEICDLGSKNGTWVNGTRRQLPVQLNIGDTVVLGTVRHEVANA